MADLGAARDRLANGEIAAALADLDAVLEVSPDDEEALYLYAVALRYAGRHALALDVLEKLKLISPLHARAHQEEGHVHRDQGNAALALRSYGRAITLNPALDACFRESARLHRHVGREREAQAFEARLQALVALPKRLRAAMELIAQNKLVKAEQICRDFLRKHPDHVRGMRLLADIGMRLGVLEDAEFLLESAAEFAPNDLEVQMEYVQVLRKRQKFAAALARSQALLSAHPDHLQVKSICAIEHMQTGDFDRAVELLDEVLAHVPGDARTLVTKGHALKTSGQTSDAIAAYRESCASGRPCTARRTMLWPTSRPIGSTTTRSTAWWACRGMATSDTWTGSI